MDSVIKKRLVGALVLIVLLLLLLPVLFSGQGRVPEARITDIPPAPVLSDAPALNPQRSEPPSSESIDEIIPEDWAEASDSSTGSESASGSEAVEQATADTSTEEPLPADAWSVQMGSFSSSDNARRLLENLRSAGYDAYTRESPLPDGGTLTQVMAGPYLDQAQAREEMNRLSEEFSVSALVVRFRP